MPHLPANVLIVRLGAMGDIVHALPAVAFLRRAWPNAQFTWIAEPKWLPLLEGSGAADRLIPFRRREPASWLATRRELLEQRFDVAIDFQGLIKSALVARLSGARRVSGLGAAFVRERPAAWFYSDRFPVSAAHVVDRALEMASALAGRPVTDSDRAVFCLPPGTLGGTLPAQPFVLACPLAGWKSKQWPMEHYEALAARLREHNLILVLNGAPGSIPPVDWALVHESGLTGLIDATRRAAFVVGVDSGPLHLAAALGKSGVAIFGPTDPARNGPRGGDFEVLRTPGVVTSYVRGTEIDPAMRAISPETVAAALMARATNAAAGARA